MVKEGAKERLPYSPEFRICSEFGKTFSRHLNMRGTRGNLTSSGHRTVQQWPPIAATHPLSTSSVLGVDRGTAEEFLGHHLNDPSISLWRHFAAIFDWPFLSLRATSEQIGTCWLDCLTVKYFDMPLDLIVMFLDSLITLCWCAAGRYPLSKISNFTF